MAAIRSLLFLLILVVVTPPYTVGVLLCWPLPHKARRRAVAPWVKIGRASCRERVFSSV